MNAELSIPDECLLTGSAGSRDLDQRTIREFGIDGFTLMEMAASGAAKHISRLLGKNKKGLYICGKGNNAGDALAVARYLINTAGHHVTVFFVFGDGSLSEDTSRNLSLLKTFAEHGYQVTFTEDLASLRSETFDYVVDGIFGTGLNSDLRGSLPEIIDTVNSPGCPVFAMDIPSGLNADTGKIHKASVQADHTFTFGTVKTGFYLNQGPNMTGKIHFIPLPFPRFYHHTRTFLINRALYDSLPEFERTARHKYESGVVHIMAGSEGLTGAAIMAAKSAWKTGAGAVLLYAPKKLLPFYEIALPHIIKIPVGYEQDLFFRERHAETIIQTINARGGVLLAGPGTGTHRETGLCLRNVLTHHEGFTILDADGLSFWKLLRDFPDSAKKRWLLTPHIGEAKKYLGATFDDDEDRLEWTKQFVSQFSCSLLTKGHPSILATGSKETFITGYDTSAFSRAGFGDVLAGSIATHLAIKPEIPAAAIKSLYAGYLTYSKSDKTQSFGPEHLL